MRQARIRTSIGANLIEANTTFLDREFGGGPANRAAWLKVLDTVAEKSGWGTPLPKGSGRGMAIDDRRTPKPRGCTVTAIVLQVSVSEIRAVNAGSGRRRDGYRLHDGQSSYRGERNPWSNSMVFRCGNVAGHRHH